MAKAAVAFEEFGFDLVDLNFACPAPKVLRRGRGGALLGNPDTAIEIYKRVRDAVKCPVSVKLRIGIKSDDGTRENFWRICEEVTAYGVDALVVHGRTVNQKYRGQADWEIVSEVKKRFNNTIIVGSGDILTAEDAVNRYKESGVDGVLIARGAIGNPWIFTDARALFNGEEKPAPPPLKEQGQVMLRHFEMLLEMRPGIRAIRYFRKFAVGYCRRHPQRKRVQMELMACRKPEEIRKVVMENFYG
jgi:nifR3 family TIM-barrel protein